MKNKGKGILAAVAGVGLLGLGLFKLLGKRGSEEIECDAYEVDTEVSAEDEVEES